MPKHVIALLASRQKRNTYGLLSQVQALLSEQDILVKIVNLHDVDLHDCLGGLHCLEKGGCVWQDGFSPLWDEIEAADGLILASPVYVANYGATLKRWVDRAFVYVHRPVLAGKPVLAVCTTGGAYLATVCRQLLNVGEMMGMRRAGAVARSSMSLAKPVKPGELRRFVRAVHRGPLGQSPTLTQVVTFFGAKLVSSFSPVDQAFGESATGTACSTCTSRRWVGSAPSLGCWIDCYCRSSGRRSSLAPRAQALVSLGSRL